MCMTWIDESRQQFLCELRKKDNFIEFMQAMQNCETRVLSLQLKK